MKHTTECHTCGGGTGQAHPCTCAVRRAGDADDTLLRALVLSPLLCKYVKPNNVMLRKSRLFMLVYIDRDRMSAIPPTAMDVAYDLLSQSGDADEYHRLGRQVLNILRQAGHFIP